MKKLSHLTTEELINRAIKTALLLMLVWIFSISISVYSSLKLLAELMTW